MALSFAFISRICVNFFTAVLRMTLLLFRIREVEMMVTLSIFNIELSCMTCAIANELQKNNQSTGNFQEEMQKVSNNFKSFNMTYQSSNENIKWTKFTFNLSNQIRLLYYSWFAIWWLDFNLLRGPDVLNKGLNQSRLICRRKIPYYVISFKSFQWAQKRHFLKIFFNYRAGR